MTLRMRVVSNTSPLSNLAIIGRLDLLRERYGGVFIPVAVRAELDALSHAAAKSRIEAAVQEGWLKVEPLAASTANLTLPDGLDPGEIEALQLYHQLQGDKIILDDALARAAALALGFNYTGLLGELVFARQSGRIASVKVESERLRADARFFVSADAEAIILEMAGE